MRMKNLAWVFDKFKTGIAKEGTRKVCRHCEKSFVPPYKTKDESWFE